MQFAEGQTTESLGLTGKEQISIEGIKDSLSPLKVLKATAIKDDGSLINFDVIARLDSAIEIEYYKNGGILHYVLRQFLKS
jgi:aconitate hydratase